MGNRNRWLAPVTLVAILLVVYSYTLLPGVGYSGDTTKFQFLGKILGTPHPTGYPTYILLNHLFVRLFPVGTVAFRANLLSAVFALGAVLFLWQTLLLLQAGRFASFVAALSFGLSRTFWSQAVVAEVYTLNAFFVAAVVYFFLLWHLHRRDSLFFVACFLYAFSFGNHLTMITLLPAIVYLVWVTDRRVFLSPRKIAVVILFVLLGAAQYSYIVARSFDPEALYLESRATSLRELWAVVSGGVYQIQMFTSSAREVVGQRLPFFVKAFALNYHLFAFLTVPGFFALRRPATNVFLLLAMAGSLLFSLNYGIADIGVYFIPIYLLAAVYVAFGLQWVEGRLARWLSLAGPRLVVLVLLLGLSVGLNLRLVNQQGTTAPVAATISRLESYPPSPAVLLVDYGYRQYLFYGTFIEGRDYSRFYQVEAFPWGHPDWPTAQAVRSYLLYGERSELVEAPAGRPVYCAGPSCPDLAREGFTVTLVVGDLYQVTVSEPDA